MRLSLLLCRAVDPLLTFRITVILGCRDTFNRLPDREYPKKDLPSLSYLLVDT